MQTTTVSLEPYVRNLEENLNRIEDILKNTEPDADITNVHFRKCSVKIIYMRRQLKKRNSVME